MITRRRAVLSGLGLVPLWGAPREYWEEKDASSWSLEQLQQFLSKSPWAKDASVTYNTGQSGPLGSGAARGAGVGVGGRRGGRGAAPATSGGSRTAGFGGTFKAIIRWESALPVRTAMHRATNPDFGENYVINMVGDVPSLGLPADDDDPGERKQKFELLQASTRIERHDEPLNLQRVGIAPASGLSRGGTLFYFSRVFAIKPSDKQVTFVTKMGPLEIKCKFSLHEMMYKGNLEL